jgi:phosphoribosylformimino-5-aminoimidazole carboxamide ribotide isomerase
MTPPFTFYPAIDLKGGKCVRLTRGEMDSAVAFHDDPAAQAKEFAAQGASWLHVVDLDGACAGTSVNGAAVERIVAESGISVQLGGGVRAVDDVFFWLQKGVSRVILGTAAVKNPEIVKKAASMYPGRIVLGVDARAGKAAVEGWREDTQETVADVVARYAGLPIAAAIYTDIGRDGVLGGPDLQGTAEIAAKSPFPVILSGGVSSYEDVKAACLLADKNVAGVISGRAIYEGRIRVDTALSVIADACRA